MSTPNRGLPADFDGSEAAIDRLTPAQRRLLRYSDIASPLYPVNHDAARRAIFLATIADEQERRSWDARAARGITRPQFNSNHAQTAGGAKQDRKWHSRCVPGPVDGTVELDEGGRLRRERSGA